MEEKRWRGKFQLGEGKKIVGIEWAGAGFSWKFSEIVGKSKKFSVIWFCSFGLEMDLNGLE